MISTTVFASLSSGSSFYVIAFSGEKTAAVSLEKDADYASISVEILSDQKDPAAQFKEIKQVQELIINKAKEQKDIEIHKGPISLSATPTKTGFAISSGYYRTKSSAAQFHILAILDEKNDIYDCAASIKGFLDSIVLPSKVKFELGQIQLAVKCPEDYRIDILKKIGEDVDFVKTAIRYNGKITLSGLEQAVLVRQVDDRKVELFINYTMAVELSESR
jgi:hypothetical protein